MRLELGKDGVMHLGILNFCEETLASTVLIRATSTVCWLRRIPFLILASDVCVTSIFGQLEDLFVAIMPSKSMLNEA